MSLEMVVLVQNWLLKIKKNNVYKASIHPMIMMLQIKFNFNVKIAQKIAYLVSANRNVFNVKKPIIWMNN